MAESPTPPEAAGPNAGPTSGTLARADASLDTATMQQPPRDKRGLLRVRRALGTIAATLGLTVVFAASLVGSVLLHLNTAPTRGVARTIVNKIFEGLFTGKVVVGELDRLSLKGVTIRSVEAFDTTGARVLHADLIRADANVLGIVRSAVLGPGDIMIHVPLIQLGNADVDLRRTEAGAPTIASVFLPKNPAPPPPPTAPPGRNARVLLERIQIDHVWAHGDLAPPGLDAELASAIGRVEVKPEGVTVDVDPAGVGLRSPLPRPLGGNVTFHLKAGGEAGVTMTAGFDGKLGDLDVHTNAQLAGTRLAARVEVAHATAAAIAALIPGEPPAIPLRVPVTAVVDVEGNIPELTFKTLLTLDEGKGSVSADGTLALRSPVTIDVAVGVHGVDPLAILDLPSATPLNADAHVWIEAGATPRIDATVKTKPFSLLGNVIPAVDAKATLANGKLVGAFSAAELGAPLHGTVTFDQRTQDVGFDVDVKVASIRGIKRVVIPVEGTATVNVKGTLHKGALDAHVAASLGGVHAPGGVVLDTGRVDGRVYGPLAALQIDANVSGTGLQASYYSWQTVKVHASGPILSPHVEAKLEAGEGETIDASASVDAKTASVSQIALRVKRKGNEVTAKVAHVAATPSGVKIDGLVVEGNAVGGLRGSLTIANKEIVGKLHGENVDLGKLAELASYPGHIAGLANLDVDLSSGGPGNRKGHVAVEFVDLEASLLKGLSGVVTATFDGDHVRTDALVRVVTHAQPNEKKEERCDGGIAQLRVTDGDGHIPGALLDPRSYRNATGHIELAADDWNLRCVQRLVPPFVPMPDLRGKLTTRVVLEREKGARLPTLKSFFAKTLGLEVKDKTWQSLHTDVQIDASLDATGAADAKVTILDGVALATVAASTKLDVPELLDRPDAGITRLTHTPIHASIDIPRHPVTAFAGLPTFVTDALPLLTARDGDTLGGDIELNATLDGTVEAPKAAVKLKTYGLAQVTLADLPTLKPKDNDTKTGERDQVIRPAVLGTWGLPIDLDASAAYDGKRATLDATIGNGGKVVARAAVDVALPLAGLMAGELKPVGSLHADFDALPVGDIPFFADRDVAGHLSGKIAMNDIGTKPSLAVDLHLDGLQVRDLKYDKASVVVEIPAAGQGGRSPAKLAVEFTGPKAGSFTTAISTEMKWKNGFVPTIDPDRAAKLDISAKKFRVAVAQPFLASVVSRMDGELNGDVIAAWNDGGSHKPRVDKIDLKLSGGIVNMPQLGQELHDVSLALGVDAQGILRINDLKASGAKGLLTGGGYAQFDGLVFKKAELAFNISKDNALPITLEGVPLGEAAGTLKLGAEANAKGDLQLKIGLPSMHLDLSAALGRSVQSADDNTDITILQEAHALEDPPAPPPPGKGTPDAKDASKDPSKPGQPAQPKPPPPLAPKIVLIVDPLNLTLKGKLLGKVPIEGAISGSQKDPVRVELGGKHARVSGLLNIPRFEIEVFHGKKFLVEAGSVKLNPDDAARSFVNTTARWDAPDGTSFNIDFVGEATPLTADKLKEKLKCRAENLSQDKCFSALLVGADSPQGTGAGGGGQTLAAQLIASEFSADIGGGFSANLGTTDDGSFKPGIQKTVGKAVLEASTYGVSGSNTTTTTATGGTAAKGQHYLVTLDWRFWRNWSLRGKVDVAPDMQTYGADVFWQYHY